jgi:pimeloyl-ACP methyl ester carboxylesterase
MPGIRNQSGFAVINNASIYYEIAGEGQPFVTIHAAIADSRQWNNEFAYFSKRFRVIRYDQRGFGKSEPVAGEFSHLGDLTALLGYLNIDQPIILMGCSMGGGLAMNFALTMPSKVKALIMVDSGPTGLELDVPESARFEEAQQAYDSGNLDLAAELETQIWFDGEGRSPAQVNQTMRRLAYEMNRIVLSHAARQLGKRLPDTEIPAVARLNQLNVPVLVIVGDHDEPYSLAAADYMVKNLPFARKAVINDAAHLSNMDQPDEFQHIVSAFLDGVNGPG